MEIDPERARRQIADFDFESLFNDLGWDRHDQAVTVTVEGREITLHGVAHKRGVQIFRCAAADENGRIPHKTTLRKIERQLRQAAAENLIIFTDTDQTEQKWYWVRHQIGEPDRVRLLDYVKGQSGEHIVQRLPGLLFTLEQEETVTTVDAARKVQQAFDTNAERVTRRFFRQFQDEHQRFLSFIQGLEQETDRRWYASIMLNRLMFIYFIQKKLFLDNDSDYLRSRLNRIQQDRGPGHFMSFYRTFLRRLMHEGLGASPAHRPDDLDQLIGRVPYLNGGIFAPHMLELNNPEIDIPDEAFERIFDFFDEYRWHLDDRSERLGHREPADNEINPDVLGYIFEKYVNQKQMGAYYTKEDITQYISQNTIIPFLFDKARTDEQHGCANAFRPNSAMWKLLADDPDRYIYAAVRQGVIDDDGNVIDLPEHIAAGIDDVTKRDAWNTPADEDYALPTEIWREHVARRQRCLELRSKLAAGEVNEINDLVTLNLDIRTFAQDVIEECEGPELLRAFWHALSNISVLDPTCGSGAFLFAAMDILEPLYEGCLVRMEEFIAEADALAYLPADQQPRRTKRQQQAFADFRQTLHDIGTHPNHAYFVFKSIVLNNLYGVDIMEEATEICRLRLFLKLVAQVSPDFDHRNLGVEPLPDIDFNIKAGNALVGFTSIEAVETASERAGRLAFDQSIVDRIRVEAGGIEARFDEFRRAQQDPDTDSESLQNQKRVLRDALDDLSGRLDEYLAGEYGIDADSDKQRASYRAWHDTHQPFHWITEFYGLMGTGGFDVIIGNPPYVELRDVSGYKTVGLSCEPAGNLYAIVIERSLALSHDTTRLGFIVPVSSISTDRYRSLQQLLLGRDLHYSSYDDRPSRLFDGLEHIRLTIHLLGAASAQPTAYCTRYNKWNSEERAILFDTLQYTSMPSPLMSGALPKVSTAIESAVVEKLATVESRLGDFVDRTGKWPIYYSRKLGYFLQVLDFVPAVRDGSGELRRPSEFKEMRLSTKVHQQAALCCLNANLFYWFTTVCSDCRHLNKREVSRFPIDPAWFEKSEGRRAVLALGPRLMEDITTHSEMRRMQFKHDALTVQCIFPKFSKPLIDDIDCAISRYYGLTDEERDFITNCDIKYRLGLLGERKSNSPKG